MTGGGAVLFDSLFASPPDFSAGFAALDVSVDAVGFSDDPDLPDDEYRSAYQPPPFKMKLPPLIWRWAVC